MGKGSMKNVKKLSIGVVGVLSFFIGNNLIYTRFASDCVAINQQPELKRVYESALKSGDVASVMWALRDDSKQPEAKRVITQKTINLCDFNVAGSNTLFCQTNKGIPRIGMPQLSSNLVVGGPGYILFHGKNLSTLKMNDPILERIVIESYDKDSKKLKIPLPVTREGGVDASDYFKEYLRRLGKTITLTTIPAYKLQATQNELVTEKIWSMWWILKLGPCDASHAFIVAPIFVSADNYILDGHHRWASVVSSAFGTINIEHVMMAVLQVDEVIGDEESGLVKIANDFTREFGLKVQAG
jgi:hypothetical protein